MDGPTITIARAMELLHCKRSRIFELLSEGKLERGQRFGRETVILTESVLALATAPVESAPAKRRRVRRSRAAVRAAELSSVKW